MSMKQAWIAAAIAVTAAPRLSEACGGLFCSSTNRVPVEQNAERVLFTANDDGTFSTYVEIRYSGSARSFSWIVPVPATPTLGTVSPSTLQLLDAMSRPTFVSPPSQCSRPFSSSTSIGCGGMEDPVPVAGEPLRAADGVTVEELERVGPFEPRVISAEDPQLVFKWLTDNGYLLTEPMRPFLEGYAKSGMKFLALKLAPDARTSDITPIKMTFQTPCPMLPLALTSVSAEPDMSILVMHLGKTRMRAANYRNLTLSPSDVRIDGTGRNNYFALVSRRMDEAGGRAFVTELATPSARLPSPSSISVGALDQAESVQAVTELLGAHTYFTRQYARLSAWEMTVDPEFEESDGEDVSNTFDLSNRPATESCDSDVEVACGDVYCGAGSSCASTAGGDGCVCKEGTVARVVMVPDVNLGSKLGVTCQDASFELIFAGQLAGPCAGFSCGTGSCVVTNGFATCACAAGEVARLDPLRTNGSATTGLICEKPRETFGPERLTWKEGVAGGGGAGMAAADSGCIVGTNFGWGLIGLLALLRRRARI